MNPLKAVLIDLSGTIHIDKDVIPGSIEALKKLRDSNKFHIKFVTNTTKESKTSLVNLLTKIGFDIKPDELFTSLSAARKFIDENNLRPFMFLADEALEDFDGVDTSDPNAVLIGLAPKKFDYENMNKAFQLISNGAKLIAIHKARYYKRKDGLALGPGAFVSGLEYSCNVKAESLGKPNSHFFLSSIQEFNIKPEECVMIGDDALDDVQGAINVGMNGILVKTGKYRPNDESKISAPMHVVDDFSQAVELILKNHQ